MKKLMITFLTLFLYVNSSFALSNVDVPDEFFVTEHWVSLTTSFDIETRTRKLGTLYRKFLSFLLTYEFYDPYNHKLATARSRFFSFLVHFDIYDNDNNILGMAEEKIFTFFPTFDIYAGDGVNKLAKASMNFWGTTFTIYDPATDREMAVMQRSFFRTKNDWVVRVTNRSLFMQKNIDPRVLMTVLAFQGDREKWEKDRDDNNQVRLVKTSGEAPGAIQSQANALLSQIEAVSQQNNLESVQQPDQKTLETVASELEKDYQTMQASDESNQSDQERISHFTEYCLNLVQTNAVSDEKKKAILFLLKIRLQNAS